jgi:hypothetical protein
VHPHGSRSFLKSPKSTKERGILVRGFQHFFGKRNSNFDFFFANLIVFTGFNMRGVVPKKAEVVQTVQKVFG